MTDDFEFNYAAGKVLNALSGSYVDAQADFITASLSFRFQANGVLEIFITNNLFLSTNWYTGGTPAGNTTFQLVTSNTTTSGSGSGSTTGPSNGTTTTICPSGSAYPYTINMSASATTGSRFRSSDFQLTITRNSQSVVYTFSGQVSTGP